MSQHDLTEALQVLVRRYGVSSVLHSLADIQDASKRSASFSLGKRVSKSKSKSTATEYVGKMTLPPEKAVIMTQVAQRFEDRAFLPSIGDIREFCRIFEIDLGKSASRTSSIPRVFTFLSAMDTAGIVKILDDGAFSGPARLAPIAEAIRSRSVESCLTRSSEVVQSEFGKATANHSNNQ